MNSCLLGQNPKDLRGSDESQELAPFSDVRSNCNFWVSFRSFVTSSFLSLKNSILDFRISVLISTSFSWTKSSFQLVISWVPQVTVFCLFSSSRTLNQTMSKIYEGRQKFMFFIEPQKRRKMSLFTYSARFELINRAEFTLFSVCTDLYSLA